MKVLANLLAVAVALTSSCYGCKETEVVEPIELPRHLKDRMGEGDRRPDSVTLKSDSTWKIRE